MPDDETSDDQEVCRVAFQCAMDVLRDKCGGKCARKLVFMGRSSYQVEYPEAEIDAIRDSSVFSPDEKLRYVKGLEFVQAQAQNWVCDVTRIFAGDKSHSDVELKKIQEYGVAQATEAIAQALLG